MATGSTVAGRTAAADEAVGEELTSAPETVETATPLDLAARRLAEHLGPRGIEDLLNFLEGGADGTYVIVRSSEGGVIGEPGIGDATTRRRTA